MQALPGDEGERAMRFDLSLPNLGPALTAFSANFGTKPPVQQVNFSLRHFLHWLTGALTGLCWRHATDLSRDAITGRLRSVS
jgi:hypothetical protein